MSTIQKVCDRLLRRTARRPDGRFAVPRDALDAYPDRVRGQVRMLHLLLAANRRRRVDSRPTYDAVVRAMAEGADWQTGAITVTHAAIGARAGAICGREPFSHDTVARVIEEAERAGVLVRPPGLGGMSRKALGGTRNQCPTYFVIDPEADLRTPPSHVSETVEVEDTYGPLKGPKIPKFAGFDERVVPSDPVGRRRAADWLRTRLAMGAVPLWVMAAMLRRQFDAGHSPAELFRRACYGPAGRPHGALPASGVRALLGCVGYRLNLWRGVQLAAPVAPQRTFVPPPLAGARSAATEATLRELRRTLTARGRRSAVLPT